MNLAQVKEHFDGEAPDYDAIVRACVPGYAAQNEILADLAPFAPEEALSVLDLGSGTGALVEAILDRFPRAHAVAYDFSANMLEEARNRLYPFLSRITFRFGDFGKDDFGAGYHLVVSGLAIHHLDDAGKQRLFQRIYHALLPGGALLVRDVVLGATDTLTAQYIRLWSTFMRRNGMDADATLEKYRQEDLPATVEDQLRWLSEAGFHDAGCHWRQWNFAVFGGRKPGGAGETDLIQG